MIWTVLSIDEDDYGCEERMPGEPVTVLVTLEAEDGRQCRFSVADKWLYNQEIDVGDEWPEDIDDMGDVEAEKCNKQAEWMDNYYEALNELE